MLDQGQHCAKSECFLYNVNECKDKVNLKTLSFSKSDMNAEDNWQIRMDYPSPINARRALTGKSFRCFA